MGKSNTELLKIAEKYLGQGGSKFRRFCGLPANAAWCNAFVDTIAAEGGDANLYFDGKKYTYVPDSLRWCYKNLADIPIYLAMPMDIIIFDWNGNGVPDHIGFVRSHNTDQKINTIEGNTSGGIVAKKTRPVKYVAGVFRPNFPSKFDVTKKLDIDGDFGYSSIAVFQKALGIKVDGILGKQTVSAWQKVIGVKADGSWGKATTKAAQKYLKIEADGYWGKESTKALQKWCNRIVFSDKGEKISETAVSLAWPLGTSAKTYAYKGGHGTAAFIASWKKWFPSIKMNADCHKYVKLVLKMCGYPTMPTDKWANIISYLRHNFKELKPEFKESQLRPGDIGVYKRVDKGGKSHWHIWIIVEVKGELMIAEAAHASAYAHINKSLKKALTRHKADYLFRAK